MLELEPYNTAHHALTLSCACVPVLQDRSSAEFRRAIEDDEDEDDEDEDDEDEQVFLSLQSLELRRPLADISEHPGEVRKLD